MPAESGAVFLVSHRSMRVSLMTRMFFVDAMISIWRATVLRFMRMNGEEDPS